MKLNKFACIKKLEEIEKYAPEYRQKHIQSRLDKVESGKDENSGKAIICILKRERNRKKFGRLRFAMQIAVSCEYDPDPVFSDNSQIEEVVSDVLSERSEAAHYAPVNSGKLLDDIVFLVPSQL